MEHPIYLVDGSGYIFRAYYAIQPLSTAAGFPTNALLGFTRMFLKLLRDKEAEYIAVAFDTGAKTFRHEMYEEYKANRKECPENLAPQMPYFRKVVEALGIRSMELEGFEADDVIATLAKTFSEQGRKVIVVSGDKDLAQLVDDNVEVWDAMRDITYDEWTVKEKFGVGPKQILDYLALCGDSSDNIPGVKGVGPKSAISLIEHFDSVDGIIDNVSSISEIQGLRGAKSLQKKIESSVEMLRMSMELVRLDEKVEPFNSISDAEELHWKSPKRDELEALFEELEFNSMANSVLELRGTAEGASVSGDYSEKEYTLITPTTFDDFAEELSLQPSFAFDTETTSLDIFDAKLVGISFSWEQGTAFYLPILSNTAKKESLLPLEQLTQKLSPIFSDSSVGKVGSNLKFDAHILASHGMELAGAAFDTMLCAHVMHPDKRDYGLKALTKSHLGQNMVDFKEMLGDKESILDVEIEDLCNYACHDADASWSLEAQLSVELNKYDSNGARLAEVLRKVELPLIMPLVRMERAGIEVDGEFLAKLGKGFSEELDSLETRIYEAAGMEFNIRSPKQISEVFFDHLGISTKGVKKTKTGFSTNAAVLAKLQGEHEVVDMIVEYRELHKLKSTYVDALPPLIRKDTGRIHASFNQAVTATGRLSSSDPNLQNIPIKNPRGRQVREAFTAKDGHVLVLADYSQVELRVLAHLSRDESLQQAFVDGEDIHTKTANELFSEGEFEAKDMRRIAKTINFGVIYGMSAFRLARELGISRTEAQIFIDNYFGGYPGVAKYFEDLREQVQVQGYVETMYGRRRYMSELNTAGRDAGYAERSLLNAPIQGSAAEIMKLSMIAVDYRLRDFSGKARIVLQVHDELIVEVPQDLSEEVRSAIVEEMESAVELSVPLVAESKISTRWGG